MSRKFGNKSLPRGILVNRGYVWIRIFPGGQRYQKCIGPASQPGVIHDAINKLSDIRKDLRLGRFNIDESEKRVMVEEACDKFVELHARKKCQSYQDYVDYFRKGFSGRFIDSITEFDMESYRDDRLESHVSPSSVNKERATFVCLFNKLKEWKKKKIIANYKLPEENPAILMERTDETPYIRRRIVTPEEFSKITAICRKHGLWRLLTNFEGLLQTLLRRQDLENLSRNNIDKSKFTLDGVQSKSEKPFSIPISPELGRIIDQAEGEKLFDFTNYYNEWRKLKKLLPKYGIASFQPRDLRRSSARLMLEEGRKDIATVQKYLGHSSIVTTQRYVQASDKNLREASEFISNAYFSRYCNINCNIDVPKKLAPIEIVLNNEALSRGSSTVEQSLRKR